MEGEELKIENCKLKIAAAPRALRACDAVGMDRGSPSRSVRDNSEASSSEAIDVSVRTRCGSESRDPIGLGPEGLAIITPKFNLYPRDNRLGDCATRPHPTKFQ